MFPRIQPEGKGDSMTDNTDTNEYLTKCSNIHDGTVIDERILDARSADDAKIMAFNSCIKKGYKKETVTVDADRIFF